MDMWGVYFDHALVFFNLLILSYFVVGNGVYTALMVISIRAIWFHSRRQAYQGLTDLRVVHPQSGTNRLDDDALLIPGRHDDGDRGGQ